MLRNSDVITETSDSGKIQAGMTRYGIDMGDNETVTLITESRNLRTLPLKLSEDQLSTGKSLEDWLQEIEREFRYFRISSPLDKKDALIIYGEQEIARLAKSLPYPEDSEDVRMYTRNYGRSLMTISSLKETYIM